MSDRALKRILVAAAAVAVFAPALTAGFVAWDEPTLIVDNPVIRGLDFAHVSAMLRCTTGGVWIPMTWLSLAADYALWGPEPAGYHLTNLLLHAASALLVYEICVLLLEDGWAPVLAALFFAVHPLRVESVAWAAERKGVLSGALWLAALLAHLKSEHGRKPGLARGAAAALYTLSLAAKPNGLSFPLVLLAADWTRRRRPSVRVYAPYFALSTAALAATAFAGRDPRASVGLHWTGAARSIGQALYGLLFYPWKTIWPCGLAPYYPPRPWFGTCSFQTAATIAAVVSAAALLRRSRVGAGLAAAYALAVLPVLGLVQHGVPFSAADRFSYLPGLAFALPFGALLSRTRARRALAAVWLTALGAASWRQTNLWNDRITLWAEASRREPSVIAESSFGDALFHAGRAEEGVALMRHAIAEDPSAPVAHEALGAALSRLGREKEAQDAWKEAIETGSYSDEIVALLGASLSRSPDAAARDQGLAYLVDATSKHPGNVGWKTSLGDALERAGRPADARRAYDQALALEPGFGRAHVNLAHLNLNAGRRGEALAHVKAALYDPTVRREANANWAALLVNEGNDVARKGRLGEAASLYREALKKDRASLEARSNLSAVESALRRQ